MNNAQQKSNISSCRAKMAKLLEKSIEETRKLEQELYARSGQQEITEETDVRAKPYDFVLIMILGLMLRKARIHMNAAIKSNNYNNMHSFAVQMRPALECIGQVIFYLLLLFIPSGFVALRKNAFSILGNRINADYEQTLRRKTRGGIDSEELREEALKAQAEVAASFGERGPTKKQKKWRLTQEDKVTSLIDGYEWYKYLSNYFCHGTKAEWRGFSRKGGVVLIDDIGDDLKFLNMISYLVEQAAIMIVAVGWFLVPKGEENEKMKSIQEKFQNMANSSMAIAREADDAMKGDLGGGSRIS